MPEKNFEEATKEDMEKIARLNGRLDLADDTKGLFKVMTKRFYRWLKDIQTARTIRPRSNGSRVLATRITTHRPKSS